MRSTPTHSTYSSTILKTLSHKKIMIIWTIRFKFRKMWSVLFTKILWRHQINSRSTSKQIPTVQQMSKTAHIKNSSLSTIWRTIIETAAAVMAYRGDSPSSRTRKYRATLRSHMMLRGLMSTISDMKVSYLLRFWQIKIIGSLFSFVYNSNKKFDVLLDICNLKRKFIVKFKV